MLLLKCSLVFHGSEGNMVVPVCGIQIPQNFLVSVRQIIAFHECPHFEILKHLYLVILKNTFIVKRRRVENSPLFFSGVFIVRNPVIFGFRHKSKHRLCRKNEFAAVDNFLLKRFCVESEYVFQIPVDNFIIFIDRRHPGIFGQTKDFA